MVTPAVVVVVAERLKVERRVLVEPVQQAMVITGVMGVLEVAFIQVVVVVVVPVVLELTKQVLSVAPAE
jgi:multisubunit Na+/H+ antiporter MnhC subunit